MRDSGYEVDFFRVQFTTKKRRYNFAKVRPCLTKYWIKYITFNSNRTVSLSEFSFFQAFAFADQILPGSDTFDLSVGPFSLSKV